MFAKKLLRKVDELASLGKPRIAFGLAEPNKQVLDTLLRARAHADITLVGPASIGSIADFPVVIDEHPERRIASLLASDQFDGLIRGTIDDFKTREAYAALTGEHFGTEISLLEDPTGRLFFAAPLSNPEGWDRAERFKIAADHAAFMTGWGLVPDIAVFSGMRHETYQRKKDIREGVTGTLVQTYEDAEWIVAELIRKGFSAKHWSIDLNPAVEAGANILIPVNGMVGNQMFRVLLLCGGKILTATPLGLTRCYEDCSRTEKDFTFHVKWLAALINKKREKARR